MSAREQITEIPPNVWRIWNLHPPPARCRLRSLPAGKPPRHLHGIIPAILLCALGNFAARHGHSVLYLRAPGLFEMLLEAKADRSHLKTSIRLAKVQLLILDDLFLIPLDDPQRNHLLEIIEDRYQKTPTVITSQCPIKDWHTIIGEPTVADAILDRLLHHAYKIELKGESIRKTKRFKGLETLTTCRL